ncbi:hypothetical protein P9265_15470 [Schinkia azotoformans]|uniref:hypothetical protein n=1 Tax=Schinkia azotoformans TaxID=1454 RepID=UPI002E1E44B5|nr:hypothetical protein [Schinkia azotoformans]
MDKRINVIVDKNNEIHTLDTLIINKTNDPKLIIQAYESDEMLIILKKPIQGIQCFEMTAGNLPPQINNLFTIVAIQEKKYCLIVTNRGRTVVASAEALRNSNKIELKPEFENNEEIVHISYLSEQDLHSKKIIIKRKDGRVKIYSVDRFYIKDSSRNIRAWRQLFYPIRSNTIIDSVHLTDNLDAIYTLKSELRVFERRINLSQYMFPDNENVLDNTKNNAGEKVEQLKNTIILSNQILTTKDSNGYPILIADNYNDIYLPSANIEEAILNHKIDDTPTIERNLRTIPFILTDDKLSFTNAQISNKNESCTILCTDILLSNETTFQSDVTWDKSDATKEICKKETLESPDDALKDLPDDAHIENTKIVITDDENLIDGEEQLLLEQASGPQIELIYSEELALKRTAIEVIVNTAKDIQSILTDELSELPELQLVPHEYNFEETNREIKQRLAEQQRIDDLKRQLEKAITEEKEADLRKEIDKEFLQAELNIKAREDAITEKENKFGTIEQREAKLRQREKEIIRKAKDKLTRRKTLVSNFIKTIRDTRAELNATNNRVIKQDEALKAQGQKINEQTSTVSLLTEHLDRANKLINVINSKTEKQSTDLSIAEGLANSYKNEVEKLNGQVKNLSKQLKLLEAKERENQKEKLKPTNRILDKIKSNLVEGTLEFDLVITDRIDDVHLTDSKTTELDCFKEIFSTMNAMKNS